MNETTRQMRISPFRTWEYQVREDKQLHWSIDAAGGLVQGPLDLSFLRGKQMLLELAPGQVAMLIGEGELRAVFLEGTHHLAIGHGEGRIPPGARMLFLAAERPVEINWSDRRLQADTEGDRTATYTVRGRCACRLTAPSRFYDAFLRHSEDAGEDVVLRVIDSLVLARIEASIGRGEDAVPTAEVLGLELQPFGLCCTDLEVELQPDIPPAAALNPGQPTADHVTRD